MSDDWWRQLYAPCQGTLSDKCDQKPEFFLQMNGKTLIFCDQHLLAYFRKTMKLNKFGKFMP